jgi:hypothetical protein
MTLSHQIGDLGLREEEALKIFIRDYAAALALAVEKIVWVTSMLR